MPTIETYNWNQQILQISLCLIFVLELGCLSTKAVRGSEAVRGYVTDFSELCAVGVWCGRVSSYSFLLRFALHHPHSSHTSLAYISRSYLSLFCMCKYLASLTFFHRTCAKWGQENKINLSVDFFLIHRLATSHISDGKVASNSLFYRSAACENLLKYLYSPQQRLQLRRGNNCWFYSSRIEGLLFV